MTLLHLPQSGVKSESLTKFDGFDLISWLSGDEAEPPQRDLFWRFWGQAAIRSGQWKYLVTGDGREMLFNIRDDKKERHHLFSTHPETGSQLKSKLQQWTSELEPTGLPSKPLNAEELGWYDYYFEAASAKSSP